MGEWRSGLFGCFGNCGVCIITYFLPCYTFGKNAGAMGDSCLCHTLLFLVPILNIILHIQQRGRIRERQDIDGSCVMDTVYTLFCTCCALVQEAQECEEMGGAMAQSMVRE